ncbi:MAG TPA: YfiR family protein [Bryobacteraceae bacterium]|nr:YfiR family protein [Bryobacteraceae bacterium]
MLACLLCLPRVHAAEPPIEYQVKAAFLLNFTRFVDWPPTENGDATVSICVLGDDPFGETLDQVVAGESRQGHKLAVRRIRRPVPPSCQVLYVSRTERDLPALFASLPSGVLTVGEGESFLRDGGMIAFVIENRRVRFDVNQATAMKAGLRISSRLLNVARSVQK